MFTATHTTTATALSYWYIITDENDNILTWSTSPQLDLSVAPPGECHVWGWSYRGEPDPTPGEHISTLNDGDCEEISSNYIRVIRKDCGNDCTDVDAGVISTEDRTSICVDGNPDPINVMVSDAMGAIGGWIITDDKNNILALPAAPPFDLDGAGPGVCFIWYMRYEDGLTGKETGNNLRDLEGCFDLSNAIEVIRNEVIGGDLVTTDGETDITICAGDEESDAFDVELTNNVGDNRTWVITDELGTILTLPASGPFDLEGAGPGICFVWNLSYVEGLTGLEMGNNINDLVGCYELSNPISVTRLTGDDCITSTETTPVLSELIISPNPVTEGVINIQYDGLSGAVGILEIYNTLGIRVYSQDLIDDNASMQIYLSQLGKGSYLVRFATELGSTTRKVIVH